MTWGQPLGLDELMIVNPTSSEPSAYFLGEDGSLYQVQGIGEAKAPAETAQFFMGEDGTLYQVQGFGEPEASSGTGQFFMGEDGTLYQIQPPEKGWFAGVGNGSYAGDRRWR